MANPVSLHFVMYLIFPLLVSNLALFVFRFFVGFSSFFFRYLSSSCFKDKLCFLFFLFFFFLNGAAVSLHQPTLCIATFVPQHHRVFIWPFLFACLPWSLDIITSLSFNQLPTLLRHFQQPCTFSSPRWVTSPGYQAFEQRIWKPLHRWWTI
ncbi:hypothetical protein BDV41DRAFT_156017 [Aspergillus transmontanensis]|uniref:Uncharacterized protein n=1 Tax=Aspergillus transmontanensis TaxID=1034304 RepID=A0A5N6WGZ5_9EURO|nr:hypothetical protein BDV41DRAFT_156017 [Aspergillus transmontanensis]